MAPELFNRSAAYTEKVDVYAFGVLLNELYTRRPPFSNKTPPEIKSAVQSGLRPDMISTTPEVLQQLITNCWHAEPQQRPAFTDIFDILAALKLDRK